MADEPLWDFAVRCYAAPDVEAACLRLQDDFGADVPVLLYCLWRGEGGHTLSADEIRVAAGQVARWQNDVVTPLRAARIALRKRDDVPPDLRESAQALRERIKELELDAERRELEWLETVRVGTAGREPGSATRQNVLVYLAFLGTSEEAFGIHHVNHLIGAAQNAR